MQSLCTLFVLCTQCFVWRLFGCGSKWQAEGPDFPAALVCRQGMVAGGGWDRRPQFSAVSPLQLPVGWRTTAQHWRLRAHVSSWSVRASDNCRWTTVNISSSSCSEEGWQHRTEAKRELLGRLGRPGYQGGVRSHCSKLEISLWLEGNQGTVQHPGRNERQGKKRKKAYSFFNEGHGIYVLRQKKQI